MLARPQSPGLEVAIFWCVLLSLVTLLSSPAYADDVAVDLTHIKGGVSLRDNTYVFEDPSTLRNIDEVRSPGVRFQPTGTDTSFGFNKSAVWIRFDASNPASHHVDWLLELPYPHLDYLDVFIEQADGSIDHVATGDLLPFEARPVDDPSFVFELATPANSTTRVYVRVKSSGVLRAPLKVWTVRDYIGHQNRANLSLWIFYGAVVVMALYNLAVAALLRKREYLYFSGLLLSLGGGIFTLSGQMFQLVLPEHPVLCNKVLSFFFAFGLLMVQLYSFDLATQLEPPPRTLKLWRYTLPPSLLLVPLSLLLPKEIGQRLTFIATGVYLPLGLLKLWDIHRMGIPQMRPLVLSFSVLAISLPAALISHALALPSFGFALWAGHIGCVAYAVIASLALPARINVMSDRLAGLNAKLSEHVTNLKSALTRAEEANEQAQRATKVKDEFMATMSHELRTPLNAIINVPQGLLRDFPDVRGAKCTACSARYLLDEQDVIDASTVCENCQAKGTLEESMVTRYQGSPTQTAHFLRRIERSGQHLLQMVNGVLDYSKMEAGRLELEPTEFDLGTLLADAVDELSGLAHTRGIAIGLELTTFNRVPTLADAVRIRQVMRNLLANAIKFSEPNSTIRVVWSRDDMHDLVSVIDQGIGIAPENHERVFASFEQVHKGDTRKYGGTGLGLSISRSLVRMHGGELWVESRLGHGSTFKFRLPRAHASSPSFRQPA